MANRPVPNFVFYLVQSTCDHRTFCNLPAKSVADVKNSIVKEILIAYSVSKKVLNLFLFSCDLYIVLRK